MRCNLRKLILIGLFASVCLALLASAQIDSPTTQSPAESSTTTTSTETPSGRRGFFSRLFTPFRDTLRKARELLSSGVDTVEDGANSVREQSFRLFMRLYNKTYPASELPKRMALFFQRRKLIEESMKSFEQGKSMFVMRENSFLDWDEDEIKQLTGVVLPEKTEIDTEFPSTEVAARGAAAQDDDNDEDDEDADDYLNDIVVGQSRNDSDDPGFRVKAQIPAKKDWRDSGCIAPPMNQKKCGACYAIATMGVVEAMRCIKQGTSPTLSTQQIVDCSTPRTGYANYGCDGGWPSRVLKYLQEVKTVSRDSCYPFVWRQQTCKLNTMKSKNGCTMNASPSNGHQLSYKSLNNERDMLYHLATTGPLIGVLQASDAFLYYGKGIFDDPNCTRKRDDVDHAIQLAGYGRENGVDYWLVKNSWGTTTWGEDGYGKLKRGTNACSIGYYAWAVPS